jgi:hypothetical protein
MNSRDLSLKKKKIESFGEKSAKRDSHNNYDEEYDEEGSSDQQKI